MSNKLRNLNDLFVHELKDVYSAEKQIISALPKMVEAATDTSLKEAFEEHLLETRIQKERLEKAFEQLGIDAGGKTCEAMAGLIKEGKSMIEEDATPETKDAALISAAQRIEHYEISAYGTLVNYAKRLDQKEIHQLLLETLVEEQTADTILNDLAVECINDKAMME